MTDITIDKRLLLEIIKLAPVQIVANAKDLSYSEYQAVIHLKALESLLKDYGITPNFEIKL